MNPRVKGILIFVGLLVVANVVLHVLHVPFIVY